ncbi:hypothetical protein AVEN_30420-1 [Araneus ventricosus]|uniref:Uncharacterized protein n=1 Tax=Araneus ventricosus TaxID=182803 RepID=A0A4Y2NW44_ARAVE|nr:hypothetical protein AVEN_30420-1 [Araneus ventricosus]
MSRAAEAPPHPKNSPSLSHARPPSNRFHIWCAPPPEIARREPTAYPYMAERANLARRRFLKPCSPPDRPTPVLALASSTASSVLSCADPNSQGIPPLFGFCLCFATSFPEDNSLRSSWINPNQW